MFDGVSDVTRQDHSMRGDLGNHQQVFAAQEIGVEPVVQVDVRIAPTPLDPFGRPDELSQPRQERLDFRMRDQDVRSSVRIQVQAMTEHILITRHHGLGIPYQHFGGKPPACHNDLSHRGSHPPRDATTPLRSVLHDERSRHRFRLDDCARTPRRALRHDCLRQPIWSWHSLYAEVSFDCSEYCRRSRHSNLCCCQWLSMG